MLPLALICQALQVMQPECQGLCSLTTELHEQYIKNVDHNIEESSKKTRMPIGNVKDLHIFNLKKDHGNMRKKSCGIRNLGPYIRICIQWEKC